MPHVHRLHDSFSPAQQAQTYYNNLTKLVKYHMALRDPKREDPEIRTDLTELRAEVTHARTHAHTHTRIHTGRRGEKDHLWGSRHRKGCAADRKNEVGRVDLHRYRDGMAPSSCQPCHSVRATAKLSRCLLPPPHCLIYSRCLHDCLIACSRPFCTAAYRAAE